MTTCSVTLESTVFPKNYLRTDGEQVNCQYTAGPWEQWELVAVSGAFLYHVKSKQFGGFLSTGGKGLHLAKDVADATPFLLVMCLPNTDPTKIALQDPSGQFVGITREIKSFNAPGGEAGLVAHSEQAVLQLALSGSF